MSFYSEILFVVVFIMIFWLRQKIIHMYNKEFFWQLTFYVSISSLLGAKLIHVMHHSFYYSINPREIFSGSGYSILGAILFGIITLFFLSIIYKANFDHLADKIFLALPLAQGFGRLANVINEELLPHATYEMFFNFLNFGVLLILNKYIKKDGLITSVYFLNYGIFRLIIEFDKGDLMKVLSIISFVFAIYGISKLVKIIFRL